MGSLKDLLGQKFGRLFVIERAPNLVYSGQQKTAWKCKCDCGNEVIVTSQNLNKGMTKSCGCLHKEITSNICKTHGMSKSPIWAIHKSMMDRCYRITADAYDKYGGRGIKVCDRWHDFENFYADMGDKPDGLSLERVNNDGDYCPENVRWASYKVQANNRRSSKIIEFHGERMTLAQLAEREGVDYKVIWLRISRGWPIEKAVLNVDGRTLRHVK